MVLRKAQGSLETCDIVLLKVHVGEVVLEKETSVAYIYIHIYIHIYIYTYIYIYTSNVSFQEIC